MTTDPNDERRYKLDLKECILKGCGGEMTEVSYYERNNWVTVELECSKCRRRFVVKAEG